MDVRAALENKSQKPQKPPLSPAGIAGEFLAGAVGAIVGVVPLLLMLYKQGELGRPLEEWEPLPYVFALFLTYPLGALISAIGVYFFGNISNQTGSFWATLAGSFLGLVVAVLISVVGMVLVLLAGPTLGAVIGFNLTRRYKSPPAS